MGRYRVLRKAVALAVIFVFLFQVDVLLYPQRGDDIEVQFRKIKESFLKEQHLGAQKRIERLMVFIDEKKLGMQKILGMCHLLLGAIHERSGQVELAKENYRKARDDYDTRKVDGVDLDSLELYQKIVNRVIEVEGTKKKKKFPWLLVAGGVVVVAVAAILLSKKKKKEPKTYTLSVTKGEGVDGNPDTGTYTYIKGQRVDYRYTLADEYDKMSITLDGNPTEYSGHNEVTGTIVMDRDHTLLVEGIQEPKTELVFVTDRNDVVINEGESQKLYVKLTLQPETEVYAKVRTVEPNSLITVTSGGELTFYPLTWDDYQAVEISAGTIDNIDKIEETIEIYDVNGVIPTKSVNVIIYDSPDDYKGPEVKIINPSDDEEVTENTDILVDARDTRYGIEKVEFFIDNAYYHTDQSSSSTYSYQWKIRDFEKGPHVIKVVATNKNDVEVEASITVNVNYNDPPTVQIISPQDGATVSGVITIKVEAQDDDGVIAEVRLLVNGDPVQTLKTSPYYFELDTNALNNGTNFIKVIAKDNAGLEAFQEIEITVDNRE